MLYLGKREVEVKTSPCVLKELLGLREDVQLFVEQGSKQPVACTPPNTKSSVNFWGVVKRAQSPV